MADENTFVGKLARQGTIVTALGVMFAILILIIPLPTQMLDILLTFNISFSLLLIAVSMYIKKPLEIAAFPSILLIATLLRLALNIATTRSILLRANAGKVITAFGNFVVGGNYVVGAVVFLIIIVIQFIVITAGATRIAEVAARFTLDAMPGKQMAIDADLNSGLINEAEARARRDEIRREADFYGAMDGASKFIRGDAVAGLIITAINIIGGLTIGVFQRRMGFATAASTYSILTIGDGLVAQIPAVIVSTAAGIVVTRAAAESDLGSDIVRQVLVNPKVLFIVAGSLLFFAVFPGLPFLPFLFLAAIVSGLGYMTRKGQKTEQRGKKTESKEEEGVEDWTSVLRVDPLELEVGYGLISLVEKERGGNLLARISALRKRIALELGFVIPPIRIRDNLALKPEEYVIKIKGVEVAKGELHTNAFLAMNPGTAKEKLKGMETKDPVFGFPAYWVYGAEKDRAEALGYTVVEPSAVVTTHIQEVIKSHAHELLGRQEIQNIIDRVRETHPTVVNELIPNIMKIGDIQKVLHNLLVERIGIRDIVTILETMADFAPTIKNTDQLTEFVRQALKRSISKQYEDTDGKISCVTMEPKFEQRILDSVQKTQDGETIMLEPKVTQVLFKEISKAVELMAAKNKQPIVLCSPRIRMWLRKIIAPVLPNLVILSYSEIAETTRLNPIGEIKLEE